MKFRIRSITTKIAVAYLLLATINLSLVCMVVYENQIDLITQNTKYRVTQTISDMISALDALAAGTVQSNQPKDEIVKKITALAGKTTPEYALFTEQGIILRQSDAGNPVTQEDILSGIKSITGRDFAGKRYFSNVSGSTDTISFYVPLRIQPLENPILMLKLSIKEAKDLLAALHRQIIFLIIVLAALHAVIGLFIYRLVISPIQRLHAGSAEIAHGDLSARVDIRQDDEIGELGSSFNAMAASIQEKIGALLQQEKINKDEMKVAGDVQKIIFPNLTGHDRFRFGLFHRPFSEVSGDYYDVFQIEGGKTGFLLVDVSGHGVPAALLTMLVKQMFKQYAHSYGDPAELFKRVNDDVCDILEEEIKTIYFTAFYCIIDSENTLSYCKAGHLNQYLLPVSGGLSSLTSNGFIVGVEKEMDYLFETQTARLSRGDRIVLLTDGILEATNDAHEGYGEKRFNASLRANASKEAQPLADALIADLALFTPVDSLKDDATVFVIEVR